VEFQIPIFLVLNGSVQFLSDLLRCKKFSYISP
jgi:hypothetical protein